MPPSRNLKAKTSEMTQAVECLRIEDSNRLEFEDIVPAEEAITILINGEHRIDVTISPDHIEEFIIGHLACHGVIRDADDIDEISDGSGWVDVKCRKSRNISGINQTIFSSCFGQSGIMVEERRKIRSNITIPVSDIHRALKKVIDSKIHHLTGGVHSCGLFRRPGNPGDPAAVVKICSDIGRHNALDKVIGAAMLRGVDLESCFALTTGRSSSEMVAKCHQVGIPILASRGATTSLAIQLSRELGLTLAAFARKNRINVYCNDHRIITEDAKY